MNVLLIGQCSLHWGRMEFGNIGNYYIIEPFVRELRAAFPGCAIRTTLQMSERFRASEGVEVLPMELYYGWRPDELDDARSELALSEAFRRTGRLEATTPYLEAVRWADLVIDFSGDIWGDNANLLGPDRFLVGLLKDRIAMNLGKPVAMLAGSPGPFSNAATRDLAREVYADFSLVTNREPISTELLRREGFDVSRTLSLACPAFLFEPTRGDAIEQLLAREGLAGGNAPHDRPLVGFVLCGWNFAKGPFDRWPRDDAEYAVFADAVEHLIRTLGARVCLMSHSNGFDVPPPTPFVLKHGRDYPVIKQLRRVLAERGIGAEDCFALDGVYDAWQTKAIIGRFDMLVSGRVHAAVAGLSQCVPTVVVDYGHEPKAHKLAGFAAVAGASDYVADPADGGDLVARIDRCWRERDAYRARLQGRMPEVARAARRNFRALRELDALREPA